MEKNRNQEQKKPVRIIAAICKDMGIGKDGKMPWNLPNEFQYFLNTVTKVSRPGKMNMMVWGKLSWFSHPESTFPLSNVLHVVLTSTLSTTPKHAHFLRDNLDSAVRLASEPPLADLIETVWVVGGRSVYKEALSHPWCDLVFLTDIMANFDCDVFFPKFDREQFEILDRFPDVPSGIQEENGIKYKCQVFKKVTGDSA